MINEAHGKVTLAECFLGFVFYQDIVTRNELFWGGYDTRRMCLFLYLPGENTGTK